jgi:hypothetical protein
VGTVAALAAAVLWWVFAFRNPYAAPATGSMLSGGLMMLACGIAAVAAARAAHLGMYLLFMVTFVPQGFVTLLGPGMFQGIGWLNLVYLAAAVLMHLGIRTGARHR